MSIQQTLALGFQAKVIIYVQRFVHPIGHPILVLGKVSTIIQLYVDYT